MDQHDDLMLCREVAKIHEMFGSVIAAPAQPTEIPGLRLLASECEFEAKIFTQPEKPMLSKLIRYGVGFEANFVKPKICYETR